jgi:glycosyltransferase involved in cell wall biosynthesis
MSSKGWAKVRFWGFRDSAEVYTFMKLKGQAGLVLFDGRIKNHQIALPNKVFEYMASGLPIIMSDIPYWKENFSNVVMFANPQLPQSIAATIDELLTSEEKQQQMIRIGLETVKSLNWDAEVKKLIDLYLEIIDSGK